MKKKNKETFKKELIERFLEYGNLFLPDLTSNNIKSRCLEIMKGKLSLVDKTILENFFDVERSADLYIKVKSIDISKFIPIRDFLKNKGKTDLRFESYINFVAWLLEFEPRPYREYLKYKNLEIEHVNLHSKSEDPTKKIEIEAKPKNSNIPPEIVLKSNSKLLKLVAIFFVGIAFISGFWLLNDFFIKEKAQPTTVIYNTYNGDLNYYYATKKDGEILLYNDFQSNNNKNLKPVTKEVMLTYFKQQQVEVTNEDQQRWFKVNLKEENNNKEVENTKISTEEVKEKPAEKPINTTKVTIKNNAVLDTQISGYFEQLYTKTNEDYVATGTVSYNFKESSFSKEMVFCELVLTYKVKLYTSNATFEVNSITKTATGLSEIDAKNNAIKKLQFN